LRHSAGTQAIPNRHPLDANEKTGSHSIIGSGKLDLVESFRRFRKDDPQLQARQIGSQAEMFPDPKAQVWIGTSVDPYS
jgi:hypothetical protein